MEAGTILINVNTEAVKNVKVCVKDVAKAIALLQIIACNAFEITPDELDTLVAVEGLQLLTN